MMNSKHRTWLVSALASSALVMTACSAGGEASSGGDGDPDTLTLSVVTPEEGMIDGTNWWAEELESRSDGRLKVDIFYNESLLSGPETLNGIKDGRITGGWYSDAYYPKQLPLFQITGIPFETTDSYAHSRTMFELYQNNEAFREEIQSTGVHITHFVPYTQTSFATKTPLDDAKDLSGKRFRAAGITGQAIGDLGSDAVFLNVAELYESVERGVIDGVAAYPYDMLAATGIAEVAPHVTDTGWGQYATTGIAVSLDWYESLPDDLRTIVDETSRELQIERSAEVLNRIEQEACDTFKEQGATVTVWDEAQSQALSDTLGDKYVKSYKESAVANGANRETVDAFYDQFHELYEKHVVDSPYQDNLSSCDAGS